MLRWSIFLWVAVSACRSPTPGAGPAISLVDSVTIAEPDSLEFLGGRKMAFTPDGGMVTETGTSVIMYDSKGRLVRTIGRPGRGPGEFVRTSAVIVPPGDSLLAVIDFGGSKIVIFGLNDGQFRREFVMKPRILAGQMVVIVGEVVVIPTLISEAPFTFWLPLTDNLLPWGAPPPIIKASLNAYMRGGVPSMAPADSGWVAQYPGEARLHILGPDGRPKRLLPLPTRRRMGIPSDYLQRDADIWGKPTFVQAGSTALGIHRLGSGDYAVVHLDTEFDVDTARYVPSTGQGVTYSNMRYWVSLVSRDLTRACVDGLVPMEATEWLLPVFRGDRMYFRPHRIVQDSVRNVLLSFAISDRGCDWISIADQETPGR